jgi:hypothetical protein
MFISTQNKVLNSSSVYSGGGTTVAVGQYNLSGDQTTNLTAGNEIEFDTETFKDTHAAFTFNTTNHQATLKEGNTYEVYCFPRFGSAGSAWNQYVLYDTTNSANIGLIVPSESLSSAGNASLAQNKFVVTPASDIVVELRIVAGSGYTSILAANTTITITEYQN